MWTALVLAGATLVVSFNWLVDPYSLFGTPRIAGFNANKVDFVEHLRLTNVYSVKRIKPDALIIGTSRAGRGLSPLHPGWRDLHCYNLSMPAMYMPEALRYIRYANAVHPLKRVVLGLDFRSFHFQAEGSDDAWLDAHLSVSWDGSPQANLFTALLPDLAASLLSSDALLDSLRTVRFQSWQNMTLTEQGLWLSLTDRYDHAKSFDAYTRNTLHRYAEYASQPFDMQQALAPFREILQLAHRHGIGLYLVISPSHAWHWETLRLAGLLPRFEDIKRELVASNLLVAAEMGRRPFPLWDFSGFHFLASEPVPTASGPAMHWFWDPVHFKLAMGDLVLDRVFDHNPQQLPGDFGLRLDSTDMEHHLAVWREGEEAWRVTHPAEVRQLEFIYRATIPIPIVSGTPPSPNP